MGEVLTGGHEIRRNSFQTRDPPGLLPSCTQLLEAASVRTDQGRALPAKRTRMPPLTSRGDPTVVGSVPTKYSLSTMFCTVKNPSKFRPPARDAVNDAPVEPGRP